MRTLPTMMIRALAPFEPLFSERVVGWMPEAIGRLERDEIDSPRMTTIRELAEALDVDPRELLADDV
jgi:transcriptional regulator with XRE-family HTH domain